MSDLFHLIPGDSPLLINIPHAGTAVPEPLLARFTVRARGLPDTDWFVDQLYDFATGEGASMLVATQSRYVIDLNRPPDGSSLYETHTTGLVPLQTFAGDAIYRPGAEPTSAEIAERTERYWRPCHTALANELAGIRARHGYAVLLDAHSIRGTVPTLFQGRLPDLNLGSFDGRSAAPGLIKAAMQVFAAEQRWTHVLDGRFKGGYNTRNYGQTDEGIHALQLEMAQCAYMREDPPEINASSMHEIRQVLMTLVRAIIDWRPGSGG